MDQLTAIIGEGAFDEAGHGNTQILTATGVGPYPVEMQNAWEAMREEAMFNYGFEEGTTEEEARQKMGPLADPTPAGVRNRGAAERKKPRRAETHGAGGRQATTTTTGDT